MTILNSGKKNRLPFFSIVISISLVLSFFAFKVQDQNVLDGVIAQYKQQAVLTLEKPIYLEFISRRLTIDQLGSLEYLHQLELAAKAPNPDQFISMLLKDRLFYPYLMKEGRLFMNASIFNTWKKERASEINSHLYSLSEYRFALDPRHYGISNFITYIVVESSIWCLFLNVFVVLLCGSFLEYYMTRAQVSLIFFVSVFSAAAAYLLFSNLRLGLILTGGATGVSALLGACMMQTYLMFRDSVCVKRALSLLVFTSILTFTFFGVQFYDSSFNWINLSVYFFALLVGAGCCDILLRLSFFICLHKEVLESNETSQIDSTYRAKLAEAMDEVGTFNFEIARAKLKLMSEQYPNSIEVMEQRYHIEKLHSKESVYWDCVRNLVNYAVIKNDYVRMLFLFEDLQRNAPSKQRAKNGLESEYYHKMMMIFVKHEDLNKAEQAFLFLELAGGKDIIKDACQLLVLEFKSRNIRIKQQQYQMLFEGL